GGARHQRGKRRDCARRLGGDWPRGDRRGRPHGADLRFGHAAPTASGADRGRAGGPRAGAGPAGSTPARGLRPSFLVRNWHLKLLSLAVAAGLWLFVAVGERSQLALATPVEYVGLPDDAVLLPDPRDRVELQVEAGRWAGRRLTSESLRVRVNVAHLPEGESQLTLAPSDVQTPPGVRVTRITPPQLRVAVAKAAEKTLRAVASVRGQPATGYAVTRVLVDPGSV